MVHAFIAPTPFSNFFSAQHPRIVHGHKVRSLQIYPLIVTRRKMVVICGNSHGILWGGLHNISMVGVLYSD